MENKKETKVEKKLTGVVKVGDKYITCKLGKLLAPGTEVKEKWFFHGREDVERLLKAGYLVKG